MVLSEHNYTDAWPQELKEYHFDREKSAIRFSQEQGMYRGFGGGPTGYKNAMRKEFRNTPIEDIKKTEAWNIGATKLDEVLNNPHSADLIPKEHWDSFENLMGSSFDIWCHPHLHFAHYKQIDEMMKLKRSKYLVVLPCSAAKPYSQMQRYGRWVRASNDLRDFDVFIFSVIPTFIAPYDSSIRYPFANYSWLHDKTSPMLDSLKILQSVNLFVDAVRALDYSKLIFIHSGTLDDRIQLLKDRYKFSDESIIDITKLPIYYDAHRYKFSTQELPTPSEFYTGMIKMRLISGRSPSLFMNDFFGAHERKHFLQWWDEVDDNTKQFCGYSDAKIKKLMKSLGAPSCGSSAPNIELW